MSVVVVGSSNVDLVCYAPRLPKPGETVAGTQFAQNFGGKGANQAVMASRIAAGPVTMVTNLGDDALGESYLQHFASEKIDASFVTREQDCSNGVALIQVDEQGNNTIVVIPGANGRMTAEKVTAASNGIAGARVLLCQNEIPLDATLEAMKIAHANNVTAIFNPAPAPQPDDTYREIVSLSDVVCPNETELAYLTGQECQTDEQIVAAARQILALGAKAVVVTLGSRGACLVNESTHEFYPTRKVEAVDTVGAGDSFLGALSAYLAARPDDLPAAIQKALQVATISVTRAGAQSSYPHAHELPDELKIT